MVNWYFDEGLAKLEREWKAEHPKAVVYKIGDTSHSANPDVSQHAPDKGGSKPGDDKGEVDAADFMEGNGVTDNDLDELAEGLRLSRDKRILIVIRRQRMFSSYPMGKSEPFEWRPYSGKYHSHTHVSANDDFDNNQSDWHWEKLVGKKWKYVPVEGVKLPEALRMSDEDQAFDDWNHIMRMQALLNLQNNKGLPRLDTDGVYGAKTVQMLKAIYGGDGKTMDIAVQRKLLGI